MKARFLGGSDQRVLFNKPDLSRGRDYLVLGLFFSTGQGGFDPMSYFIVEDDAGRLIHAPTIAFELVDNRGSDTWSTFLRPDGSVRIEPESFSRNYFFDRLSDDDSEAQETLGAAKRAICAELGYDELVE